MPFVWRVVHLQPTAISLSHESRLVFQGHGFGSPAAAGPSRQRRGRGECVLEAMESCTDLSRHVQTDFQAWERTPCAY